MRKTFLPSIFLIGLLAAPLYDAIELTGNWNSI